MNVRINYSTNKIRYLHQFLISVKLVSCYNKTSHVETTTARMGNSQNSVIIPRTYGPQEISLSYENWKGKNKKKIIILFP